MDISVIIPAYNEEESLSELTSWIRHVMEEAQFTFEVIIIDDGSSDGTWKQIESVSEADERMKGIRFRRNYGKSAALNTGFVASKGDVVITMDADLQDSPDEIPSLYAMIKEDGYDMVSGWKKKRHDPITKTIPSKLFNWVTRKMSGIELNDFNCGLKAYDKDVIKVIEVYGEMHRYIPVIVKWAGFKKIGEKVVCHQERKYGVSKFGIERFINGFLDLLSITFVGKFSKKPMHFFGTLGVVGFGMGFLILLYLSISKLLWQVAGMTERPLFYFGIISLIVGTQLFLTGFLAELISRNASHRNTYFVSNIVGEVEHEKELLEMNQFASPHTVR